MMHLVLLSGGSGKRLWPLSNDSRSKQFLKVLLNKNGEYESMIQRVWRQIKEAGLAEMSLIATSASQREIVLNQLDDRVNIVVEPERRDTFAAIALASLFLRAKYQMDPCEVITVLPVDPYVEAPFFDLIKNIEYCLTDANADLALIGVRPTYPAESYGYIIPHDCESKNYLRVDYFKEKPGIQAAGQLMQQQALWNCGVFAFRLGYILSILEYKGLPTDYDTLLENYSKIGGNSFDYEVVEHAQEIIVLPYEGQWKDLGTWNTLTDEMTYPIVGKGIIKNPHQFPNNHIVNELGIPIAVIGVSGVVVAASPDGILVSSKDVSPLVKEIAGELVGRPMYVERRWGWYRILDYTPGDLQHTEVLTRRVHMTPGTNLSYHVHRHRMEIWTILSGEGQLIIDYQLRSVSAGDTIQIDRNVYHTIKASSDLEFIEVQMGEEVSEEDISRLYFDWNDILCLIKQN